MPELPDVTVYVEALARRLLGEPLRTVRLASPFLLRSVDPPLAATFGKRVVAVRRVGKRIVLGLEDDLFLVLHLMIAGRLRWRPPDTKLNRKLGLAAFDFPAGTLVLTEASTRKRAGLWCVRGVEAVAAFDAGGIEPQGADLAAFTAAIQRERHTIKRTLTDPRFLAGIGNAYSDEILHRARLSPIRMTHQLTDDEIARLHVATQAVLREFTERIRAEVGDGFPEKVTAFRDDMAVHGRYGQPCPVCGSPVQRIVHAENETNYCATCQTGGRLLADRSLSRLLKQDWPRSLEELEERRRGG
jgi:formamidopyrimidine-DNA glycosylase